VLRVNDEQLDSRLFDRLVTQGAYLWMRVARARAPSEYVRR
jgi:hypothetical protein